MNCKKILIIPDCHFPYNDKKAWKLLLKAGKALKPDIIVTLGDFADFYAVSSHSKDPNRPNNLEYEVDSVKKALSQLDALGAKRKVFIAGNHCDRLERYLMDKAPELFNVVKIPELLELKKNGWQYVPYKSDVRIGKVFYTHDVGSAGKGAVFAAAATYQHNVVTGHNHRLAYIVEGNATGQAHVSTTLGWLGDARGADYMHRVKAARDWALGFGVGYIEPSGTTHITPIPIINYRVIIEGRLITL
jgi:predicted MPP superfamily phosphohydrolase